MGLKLIGDNPSGPFAPILSDTPVKTMKVKGISERCCAFFPFNNVPKKPVHVVFGSPLKN